MLVNIDAEALDDTKEDLVNSDIIVLFYFFGVLLHFRVSDRGDF